jgi:hypothetical protein
LTQVSQEYSVRFFCSKETCDKSLHLWRLSRRRPEGWSNIRLRVILGRGRWYIGLRFLDSVLFQNNKNRCFQLVHFRFPQSLLLGQVFRGVTKFFPGCKLDSRKRADCQW